MDTVNEPPTPIRPSLPALIRDVLSSKTAFGIYGTGALTLCGLVFGLSPLSPLALGAGDLMLGVGRADLAVWQYDAIAQQNPDPYLRVKALERSASVWSIELGDRTEARKRLFTLTQLNVGVAQVASVHAEIGALFDEQHKPRQAARHYGQAHQLDPAGAEAADRLARAAEILQREGLDKKALQAWTDLANAHPNYRARADLGQAQIRLAQGDEQWALGLFESAENGEGDLAAIARLGAATCLERLGDLDEALAALDAADLPEEVRETRAVEIIDRADRRAQPSQAPVVPGETPIR